jgi:3',5'-cyclic AMP phosphodiesterase CpdA
MDWSRTVHGIGDLHAGALSRQRAGAVLNDVAKLSRAAGRPPALHLQIGDATEHGNAHEDRFARDWLGRLPGRHHTIVGNHDIWKNKQSAGRSAAAWARAYGYRSQNYTIDLGFVRIIAIGPDRLPKSREGILSQATLNWLERELARAPGDCWIACHWPLYGTVGGDRRKFYTSTMPTFHAKPHAKIGGLLARHPNAKAWLSGHTHSPLSAPGLVARFHPLRARPDRWVLAVNLSALIGVGKVRQPTDPLCSVYLTHYPGHIEVRYRDHRRGTWGTVVGPGFLVAGTS